jgi:hypothetical protein
MASILSEDQNSPEVGIREKDTSTEQFMKNDGI